MLIVYDKTARRLGEETRREVGQRCGFWRRGDGGVGFGECDLLRRGRGEELSSDF